MCMGGEKDREDNDPPPPPQDWDSRKSEDQYEKRDSREKGN
jgi:hypothetical protein